MNVVRAKHENGPSWLQIAQGLRPAAGEARSAWLNKVDVGEEWPVATGPMTWPLKGYPFGTEGSGVVSPVGAKVRVVRLLIRADVRSVRRP